MKELKHILTSPLILLSIGVILCAILIGLFFAFHHPFSHQSFAKQKEDSVWQTVENVLQERTSSRFVLQRPTSLIQSANAASLYDSATSYIAVDLSSGAVYAEKNADASVPIASLTKIMSAMVTLDLSSPTDEFTITNQPSLVSPTKIGVEQGERLEVKELLEGMLMTSANDAAEAVRDGINQKYGADIFVKAMNEKARLLGLTHTHFSNPQGFDGNNYSSASDLALLTQYALTHYPVIAQIVTQPYTYVASSASHKQYDLYNWNSLLGVYPGTFGVKIGNTDNAGYTMIVGSKRNGHSVLAVLLGAPDLLSRDLWTASLLDDTFSQQFGLAPVTITVSDLEAKYATWRYWN